MIRELWQRKDVFLTRGRTRDNVAHLAPRVLEQLTERYAGTRLGRQELDAELLQDTEGALWQRAQLDACRVQQAPELRRVVVAIDPAMSSGSASDETGIVAAGRGVDGLIYVLADWSGRFTPEACVGRAVALFRDLNAAVIVAEVNAGGELVERVLRQIAPQIFSNRCAPCGRWNGHCRWRRCTSRDACGMSDRWLLWKTRCAVLRRAHSPPVRPIASMRWFGR